MKRFPRDVEFFDDNFESQKGIALERNGNLTLVEKEDGSVDWLSPFEVKEKQN